MYRHFTKGEPEPLKELKKHMSSPVYDSYIDKKHQKLQPLDPKQLELSFKGQR